ncbi:MAG: hypothetical protein HY279_08890 [Nitrospinae bacterium]|nr:hypothetical protein [Nitrospinota bacterium]
MAGITNLQQVLSMSGAVEKVQQVQQKQTVVHGEQFSAALKNQDELKRTEVPTTEKTEDSKIREEHTDRGGVKYRYIPRKKKKEGEEKEEKVKEEKLKVEGEQGNIVDIVV